MEFWTYLQGYFKKDDLVGDARQEKANTRLFELTTAVSTTIYCLQSPALIVSYFFGKT